VPGEHIELLERCIEEEPQDRIADAAELLAELEKLFEQREPQAVEKAENAMVETSLGVPPQLPEGFGKTSKSPPIAIVEINPVDSILRPSSFKPTKFPKLAWITGFLSAAIALFAFAIRLFPQELNVAVPAILIGGFFAALTGLISRPSLAFAFGIPGGFVAANIVFVPIHFPADRQLPMAIEFGLGAVFASMAYFKLFYRSKTSEILSRSTKN
jgi:hypothetical protein